MMKGLTWSLLMTGLISVGNYGTIIVDLKRHKLIDLLSDRSVSTVASF